ncbi:carboxypeptidase-like regulatory domain-containing protein, partial [Muriicola sp.]|uniref:carboxypeptidase-like regulatory domain-containing protein n=1 Tax=Muriicola sp. TaxID=2020856 RepID=UPI003C709E9D
MLSLSIFNTYTYAQEAKIIGAITDNGIAIPFVNIRLKNSTTGTSSNESGEYELDGIQPGRHVLLASALGYKIFQTTLVLKADEILSLNFELIPNIENLDDIVVTGTLKP